MEIERKFLINELPKDLDSYEKIEIEQGYISNKPTIRIRKANEKYLLTVKSKFGVSANEGGPIVNNEHEFEITKEEYKEVSDDSRYKNAKIIKLSGYNKAYFEENV